MELRHLRYFVAVAEELSFTAGARRLGIAQPPLSVQIRQLESELGCPLFNRARRQVNLTEAGRDFLNDARTILTRVDEAAARIRNTAAGRVGSIRLGYLRGTLSAALLKRFRKFGRKQRGAILHLEKVGMDALQFAAAADYDGIIAHRDAQTVGITEIPLESSTICVAVPPKHRLAECPSFAATDLIGETLLVSALPDRSVPEQRLMSHLTDSGLAISFRTAAAHPSEVFVAVALGHGIAACSAAELLAGDTVLVPWRDPHATLETVLVPNPRSFSEGAQILAEFLQQ